MRRSRSGITKMNKPIGTFLFMGPTGVGKTETTKALAALYFGSEEKIIRFDMSEYQGETGLKKALGNPDTAEPGTFAQFIRQLPFAVLLLDELEKTDPKIMNLLLVLLDEGFITDNFGKKIDCRHLIVIGTSNAGSEYIRKRITQKVDYETLRQEIVEYVQEEKIFSPELLNRFDEVVVYHPLSETDVIQIAKLLLQDLNKRLAGKEISIKITDDLARRVAQLGYQPEFGARPMKRVIQDKIEDQIAQRLLKGDVKRGEEIEINI
jgi:ATP-dependent Clp protease ATP-binding subunit ClpC